MKLGIIGAGNMGISLVKGILKTNTLPLKDIVVSDLDEKKLEVARGLGIETTKDNLDLVKKSEAILIAVKPNAVEGLLDEIGGSLKEKIVISIAAGVSVSSIETKTGGKVVRMMPNLCAEVAEMAACYSVGRKFKPSDEKTVQSIFGELGTLLKVEEKLMDAVTGLSGSGPAFFFSLINAAAEAGSELGLPRETALALAAQTAKGAGAMAAAGDPVELVRKVSTPKGTTVEGLKILDERKTAEAMKDAVKAAARRARELSR